ncbi:MAG TPA: nuclear transport factor 2 family protein [Bacteroidales bacterium]|jgi:ketosteroid isomerase-like protein|nr:nuclear transport factor 2 family protein [Bacteroidales bacterium]
MKSSSLILVLIFTTVISCNRSEKMKNKWKAEIVQTEKDFAYMAAHEGISVAFAVYAADDVVLLRNDSLIKGRDALIRFYNSRESTNDSISLTWEPDFAEVSASGDLGYTFGKYTYSITDTAGNTRSHEGIFHTVWKRQKNGEWKFVWD